jgi:hypothetical protein
VRVPRRPDIPGNEQAPNAEEKLSWDFSRVTFSPLPANLLPEKCWRCEGRGHKHDCPDCRCTCEYCDGTGKLSPPTVRIGRVPFAALYVDLIQKLPGTEIGKPKHAPKPLPFRFEGGEGLLMPMCG